MSDSIVLGNGIEVRLRRSSRARRMTLRVPRAGGEAVLTLPDSASLTDGRRFAEEKRDWLQYAIARRPLERRVAPGVAVPVAGRPRVVTPAELPCPRLQEDRLLCPARKSVGPVVRAFLRHYAHQQLQGACDRHSAALGRGYRVIALRDTRSRWGSCSSDGRLMFSWRLAMAPPEVLDYVAAHEVAHLAHMDHSARFWAQVAALMPDFQASRSWLRNHGNDLMIWKFRD
ncbi:SprT family zinc-dependent metalloprotease [Paracoccus sp. Z330]|uniref:SprT family zinc-dependent metalloprotease n=1 Tax=Paracoccus onchidii TaxID=3017813 RepID=A0ABT4ZHM7_9RHOB|nr:SprT family zinc-dependent metalloprotease [Paracoccus onchidii]MDB6178812.1 SprT family zinc-dependent metalloprotease [Paracoccus onchidii]